MADSHPDTARLLGTVKWFSGHKGYGFLTPDDGAHDLFVHQTEIQSDGFRTLREGQRVQFIVATREDGRTKAIDVVILARRTNRRGGYGRGHGGDGVECYNCGRIGHLARDCYGRRGRGRGGGGGQGCYNCGEEGHLARNCPIQQT